MPMKTNHIIRVSYELSDWDHFYLAHYTMGSNGLGLRQKEPVRQITKGFILHG